MAQLNRLKKNIVSEASRLSSFLEEKLGETPETAPCLRGLVLIAQEALRVSVTLIDPYLTSATALHRRGTDDLKKLASDMEDWNLGYSSKLVSLNSELNSIEVGSDLEAEQRAALRYQLDALKVLAELKQSNFAVRQQIGEFISSACDAETHVVLDAYLQVLRQRLNHFDFAEIFRTMVSKGLDLAAKAAGFPGTEFLTLGYDGVDAILATLEEYKFPSSKTVKGGVRFEVFMRALEKNTTAWKEAAEVLTKANVEKLDRLCVHA